MYSVVMMMALSGGAEVTDFGRQGGYYGGSGTGCFGCYGGSAGYGTGCFGCYGGNGYAGCYGGRSGGCCGGGYGCYGGWCGGVANGMSGGYVPAAPAMPPPASRPEKIPVPPRPGAALDNRATIVVTLPADAKLTFDGKLTASTSNTRWFVTPPLRAGLKYQYVLRAEIVRDGVPGVVERTVLVRPNEESRVSLDFANGDFALR
jgi:uncharacterized protein (TIGR03000 family)